MIYGRLVMTECSSSSVMNDPFELLEMSVSSQTDMCIIYNDILMESGDFQTVLIEGKIADFFSGVIERIKNMILKFVEFVRNLIGKFTGFLTSKIPGLKKKQESALDMVDDDEFWDEIFDDFEDDIPDVDEPEDEEDSYPKRKRVKAKSFGSLKYNIKYKDYFSLVKNAYVNGDRAKTVVFAANATMKMYDEIIKPVAEAPESQRQTIIDNITSKIKDNRNKYTSRSTRKFIRSGEADISTASDLVNGFKFNGDNVTKGDENDYKQSIEQIRNLRNNVEEKTIAVSVGKSEAQSILKDVGEMIITLDKVSGQINPASKIVDSEFKKAISIYDKIKQKMKNIKMDDLGKIKASDDNDDEMTGFTFGEAIQLYKENLLDCASKVSKLSQGYNVIFTEITYLISQAYSEANKITNSVISQPKKLVAQS